MEELKKMGICVLTFLICIVVFGVIAYIGWLIFRRYEEARLAISIIGLIISVLIMLILVPMIENAPVEENTEEFILKVTGYCSAPFLLVFSLFFFCSIFFTGWIAFENRPRKESKSYKTEPYDPARGRDHKSLGRYHEGPPR